MAYLLKMVIFHSYVSLQEGIISHQITASGIWTDQDQSADWCRDKNRPKSPRMTLAGFKLRSYLFPRKLACNWQWPEKRISNVLLYTLQPPTGNKSLGWLWCRTLPDLNLTKQTGNGTTLKLHHVTVSVVLAGFHQARGRPACLPQKQVVMCRPS